MVNFLAVVMCLIYVKHMGWYLNGTDIAWIILDVICSIIWRSAVQYHLLSAEDAGTAVSCWNDA